MEFEWSTNDIAKKTVTIYSTNLTLNKAACRHFEEVDFVLLGIDRNKNVLGIKPVGKKEINDALYPEDQFIEFPLEKATDEFQIKTLLVNYQKNII